MKEPFSFTPAPLPNFPNHMQELRLMHQETLQRLDALIALQQRLVEAMTPQPQPAKGPDSDLR